MNICIWCGKLGGHRADRCPSPLNSLRLQRERAQKAQQIATSQMPVFPATGVVMLTQYQLHELLTATARAALESDQS